MRVTHPLFNEREIPIVPHKYSPYGWGTGFIPVNAAHNEKDNETAEIFSLSTKGFVGKDGKLKHQYLGEEWKGMSYKDE